MFSRPFGSWTLRRMVKMRIKSISPVLNQSHTVKSHYLHFATQINPRFDGNLIIMSYLLPTLTSKKEIDKAIKETEDVVLVLRFGQNTDSSCLQLDDILSKTAEDLVNMAAIYLVDVDKVPVYKQYFDISLIPSTIFFFNGQHIKVDWGSPDHTKFVGSFKHKQDFIDVVEVIYRGAMKGKVMITSPLDPQNIPKYHLIYKDI